MAFIPLPDFSTVVCPWLAEQGVDPYTFARDGFCNACGETGHPTG